MVCCLCVLVTTAHMPRWWTNAPTHKEPTQGECGQFCHFGTCALSLGHHHAMASGELWEPSVCRPTLSSHRVPHRMLGPVSKPSWRTTLGDIFVFGTFCGMPNHPILDPDFSPSCGLLATPYLHTHMEFGPNSEYYT